MACTFEVLIELVELAQRRYQVGVVPFATLYGSQVLALERQRFVECKVKSSHLRWRTPRQVLHLTRDIAAEPERIDAVGHPMKEPLGKMSYDLFLDLPQIGKAV